LSKKWITGFPSEVFRLFYKEIEVFSKELDTSISQEILNRYNISPLKSRVVLYDLENQVEGKRLGYPSSDGCCEVVALLREY